MYRADKSGFIWMRAALCALVVMLSLLTMGASSAEDTAVADENLFNRRDPFFAEGVNYIQSTDQITIEPDSFITGFIAVKPGDIVSVNLNSTRDSEFMKYALYDTNKVWQDTVKLNYLSEMTIRIFEPGFVRISVYGLEFEKTISIYISAAGQGQDMVAPDILLTSTNNTNILVKTTDEDPSVYYTDRFDRADPDFLDKFNFVQQTNTIVGESDSFITGYIPVAKGDAVILTLGIENKVSPFIKYALYDTQKNWIKTVRNNRTGEVTAIITDPGYIRFSVNGRSYKNSVAVYIHPALKLSADQQMEDKVIPAVANAQGHIELFNNTYLSTEVINLFNEKDPEFMLHRGYTQLTGDIVEDDTSFLTGYIPVVSGQAVIVSIGEDTEFAKYAMYDQNKQWLTTTRVNHPTMLIVPVTETGYFRFHGIGSALKATTITIPTVTKVDINMVSGNIQNRLERLETKAGVSDQVDVVIFMGQSNMAGRGIVTEEHPEDAPEVLEGAGWEFRSVSDPTRLHRITKEFGHYENVTDAINDLNAKTGGIVPSLINAYYTHNGRVPTIAISASEGYTSVEDWAPESARLNDAISRLQTAVTWLESNNYSIRHKYMVWCQGETDVNKDEEWYIASFKSMFDAMKAASVEKCFLIRVGNTDPETEAQIAMMKTQNKLCKTDADVIMASNVLSTMLSRGLMKDNDHYYQVAYNECGEDAGINMAYYVNTGKEPMMYDSQFNELYFASGF